MERKHTTLWQFLRQALRHTWLLLYGVLWSLFGTATRIRDNFLPSSWKQALETHHVLNLIPTMGWQSWVIGIMAGVIFAIVRFALLQLRERETALFDAQVEVDRLEDMPLLLDLRVHETIHRPSFETHSHWNRDIFLRITAELKNPMSADVKYEFSAILQGRTLKAEWLQDVDEWCRKRIVRDFSPFDSSKDEPCYLMDELPTGLQRGRRVDGWLHFRTIGVLDGELSKCKLRLIAESQNGASGCDLEEGSFRVLPGEWKVIQKEAAQVYASHSVDNPLPPPI